VKYLFKNLFHSCTFYPYLHAAKDSLTNMDKILHVTESMAGGILSIISRICELQNDSKNQLKVIYIKRNGTPDEKTLKINFFKLIEIEKISESSKMSQLGELFVRLRSTMAANEYDVMHLHSSIAGFLGRAARMTVRTRTRIYYSPHGYAFLNTSLSPFKRKLYLKLEQFASLAPSTVIATCKSESHLAQKLNKHRRVELIQTGVPSSAIIKKHRSLGMGKPTVAMIGRVCPQKNPQSFNKVAQELMHEFNFVWIGDFDPDHLIPNFWFTPKIKITGWLTQKELLKTLSKVDLLLFQSLWEGFALSIPLAQSLGIPVITNDSPGNVDAIEDGRNGLVCNSHNKTLYGIRQILQSQRSYEKFSKESLKIANLRMIDDDLGSSLLKIYDL